MPILAAVIPAVIGAGVAVYSANAAGKAQKSAVTAQNTSTQESLAAQQAALDRITQINQPFIAAGSSVLPGLQSRVNTGAPNFSSPAYARPLAASGSTPAPLAPVQLGQFRDRATGGADLGTVKDPAPPMAGDPATAAPPAAPVATGPDWDAYIRDNPDVAAWIAQGHGDPAHPGETPEEAAAYHYQNGGQAEGRALPMLAPQPSAGATPNAPPPGPQDLGTASGVVPNFTRPDQGTAPSASDFINPGNFTTSPGYQFRLDQGLRNTNASFGAKGLLQSGAALQGFNDYAQNSASAEYNNWFNQQQQLYGDAANRFNLDRNNTNNNFAEDRSYGTNLAINNRDFANNQYNTQTQNMFQLAGIGTQAAGAISGANNSYANNASNLFTAQGNNNANAALAQGATSSQLAGTLGGIATNLFAGTPRASTPIPGSGVAPNGGNAVFVNPLPSYNYGSGPF